MTEGNVHEPSVVGTGLVALDIVIDDEKDVARAWAGGTCGNVLTILSYLGWQAFPVARLNGDTAAKRLKRDLERWRVHLEFVDVVPTARTPVVVHRITEHANRTVSHTFSWCCPSCGAKLPRYRPVAATAASLVASQIEKPAVFFFDRPSRGAIILARASAEMGAVVVFEPSGGGDVHHLKEALDIAHIVKYSQERAWQISHLLESSTSLLQIETLGPAGLRYRSAIDRCRTIEWAPVEAYPVPALRDAAGAGDWCIAGIICKLAQDGLEGLTKATPELLRGAVSYGQALASWTCGFKGARGGMYVVDRNECDAQVRDIMTRVIRPREQSALSNSGSSCTEGTHALMQEICPSCSARGQDTSTSMSTS